MANPPKEPHIEAEIRRLLANGLYRETEHAKQGLRERHITPGSCRATRHGNWPAEVRRML